MFFASLVILEGIGWEGMGLGGWGIQQDIEKEELEL